jgi:hypothetical protein
MSWLANILIWGSMAGAAYASVTAYWPSLDIVAASDPPLTLSAPAGSDPANPGEPLVFEGPLTPEVIEQLRTAGETRVQVKEFAWARWSGRYIFLASCVGLVLGAKLLRRGNATDNVDHEHFQGKHADLLQVTTELQAMMEASESSSLSSQDLLSRVEQLQQGPLAAFVESLPQVVSRLGLGRYAQMMNRYAEGERLLNRAWSAAVDHADEESRDCLRRSHQAFLSAIELLQV